MLKCPYCGNEKDFLVRAYYVNQVTVGNDYHLIEEDEKKEFSHFDWDKITCKNCYHSGGLSVFRDLTIKSETEKLIRS